MPKQAPSDVFWQRHGLCRWQHDILSGRAVWPAPLSVPNPDTLTDAVGDAWTDPVNIARAVAMGTDQWCRHWRRAAAARLPIGRICSRGLQVYAHLARTRFRRWLLTNLQYFARRSLLYVKSGLHSILQTAIPLQDFPTIKYFAGLQLEAARTAWPRGSLNKD